MWRRVVADERRSPSLAFYQVFSGGKVAASAVLSVTGRKQLEDYDEDRDCRRHRGLTTSGQDGRAAAVVCLDGEAEELVFIRRKKLMKLLRGELIAGMSLASLMVISPLTRAATISAGDIDGSPKLLTELDFSSTAAPASTSPLALSAISAAVSPELSAPGWNFWAKGGGSIGVQATASPDGNGTVYALEGSYPAPGSGGGNYMGASYNVSALNTEDIYIEFWAKMPGVKEGCKFLKIFGARSSATGYANATIYTDYTGAEYGAIRQIGFGDGKTIVNDSQNVINLSGTGTYIGRSVGTAKISTPQKSVFSAADWGNGWHHFRVHVKFNSGTNSQNEVPDGEYYLEIDGKVYVDATGIYNRNPANGPIASVEFFGWAQTESQPFQVWYDGIRISTGGFMSTPLPDPPSGAAVK